MADIMADPKEKSAELPEEHHSEIVVDDSSKPPKKHRRRIFKRIPKRSEADVAEKAHPRRHLFVRIVVVILILAVVGGGGYAGYKAYQQYKLPASTKAANATNSMNEALRKGNKAQALADAKKALAYEPNDPGAIGSVAALTPDHAESQQLYGQLLTIYKKSSGSSAPTPVTYWAEGNLAEEAGDTDQARQDYQQAIAAAEASPSNSYYQGVAQRAQTALKELQ